MDFWKLFLTFSLASFFFSLIMYGTMGEETTYPEPSPSGVFSFALKLKDYFLVFPKKLLTLPQPFGTILFAVKIISDISVLYFLFRTALAVFTRVIP